MKKNILVFIVTLILTFAFSTSCFAKVSPGGKPLPTEQNTTEYGSNEPNTPNDSEKSPKTGVNAMETGIQMAIPFVALITAAGVILVAKKGYSKAE